ncbi:hypothetical protein AOLI_G00248360 [Acnodon oligacanthus]
MFLCSSCLQPFPYSPIIISVNLLFNLTLLWAAIRASKQSLRASVCFAFSPIGSSDINTLSRQAHCFYGWHLSIVRDLFLIKQPNSLFHNAGAIATSVDGALSSLRI